MPIIDGETSKKQVDLVSELFSCHCSICISGKTNNVLSGGDFFVAKCPAQDIVWFGGLGLMNRLSN